ncbi:EthD domain-containing protein [Nocardioides sp. Root140]|uniref:EthD domain-containing protein n=1 Tax=Nocardioides sp. Root140 TaxID=1736460 RepID=UPI0006F3C887|nr:EthD domain-containing protein [Nocardioides sp. Root140]KQY54306.1 hypothetical protein ASD30_19040 [Nocardioides sp. Root140]
MEKLIYAVTWPADADTEELSTRLRGPVADELRASGARGLQVNVSDSDVASATLRRPPSGHRVDAVVSLWVDTWRDAVRGPLERSLLSMADAIAGWVVTESVPIEPSDPSPGERTPGLSNIAFIRRSEAMSHPDWLDYWHNHHTDVAIETQASIGYVQNTVVRSLTADAFPVDAIVEELFPIEAQSDPHVWYGSGGDQRELDRRMGLMFESCAKFLGPDVGVVPSSRFVMSSPFA